KVYRCTRALYTVDNFLIYFIIHEVTSQSISVTGAVIPMPDIQLLEPSFLDAITSIESAGDLSERQRRHWVCSLRQVAKWLDRPSATIPARLISIRIMLAHLHHARVGVTAKTVANHRANVRAALRWYGKEHDVPQRGVPLSLDWARVLNGIEDRHC